MEFPKGGSFTPKQKPLIKTGSHLAVCYAIIDLGSQEQYKYGSDEKELKKKLYISWEFPGKRAVYNEDIGEQIMAHHEKYNQSGHEKSAIMKLFSSWQGREFDPNTDEPSKFLGRAINIVIKHQEDSKKRVDPDSGNVIKWMKISGVPSPLNDEMRDYYEKEGYLERVNPKQKIYKTENPKIYLDLKPDNYEQDVFDELPKWLQKTIASSPEFQSLVEAGIATAPQDDEEETYGGNAGSQKPSKQPSSAVPAQDDEDDIDF